MSGFHHTITSAVNSTVYTRLHIFRHVFKQHLRKAIKAFVLCKFQFSDRYKDGQVYKLVLLERSLTNRIITTDCPHASNSTFFELYYEVRLLKYSPWAVQGCRQPNKQYLCRTMVTILSSCFMFSVQTSSSTSKAQFVLKNVRSHAPKPLNKTIKTMN